MSRANPFGALARMFRRSDNAVISALYTHCIGRPLFVEPRLGAELLAAYMAGPVEEIGPRESSIGKVGILNISGALANRPMPGPSGDGPQNYEELKLAFDMLLESRDVDAIVLRLDSPGGFAAGLFDFTDHIAASRGAKPIHAVVDDFAFSAAYAIAASADTIWVSRTGGVGSVGVVSYHVDQSARDAQQGYKITPIFAGEKKIDFSPHFPLSERALNEERAEVDRLYELFVASVARYRGDRLSVETIRESEAGLFYGEDATKKGFADRLGTLHDALQFLGGTAESSEDESATDPEVEVTTAAAGEQDPRATLALAILEADLPGDISKTLLGANIAAADVAARIQHAKDVIDACKVAGVPDKAARFIARNLPLADVRAEIVEHKAALDEARNVNNRIPAGAAGAPRAGVSDTWLNVVKKFGAKV